MGLFGNNDSGFDAAMTANERNRKMFEDLELPQYRQFTPELYDNESANFQLTSDDPVMKSKQLEALARMEGLSETGLSGVDDAAFYRAKQMGDQMARAKTDAAINDAQLRGVAGGGQEFAMREQAAQGGAQRAQEAAMARAEAAANQRAQYLNAYANQAAGARDQDYRTNANNSDIINKFNMANTQGRNQAQAANVGAKNDAFKYNEGLKDKTYGNQLGKNDRIAGSNNDEAKIRAAQADRDQRQREADQNAVLGFMSMGAGAYGAKK